MPPQLSNTPSGNQNQFFGQKVSRLGINVNSAGDSDLIYKNDFSTTLYYDESGIPNALLGLRNLTGKRGLYVSQTGIDVTTATDSQLIFNSDQDIFKVVVKDTAKVIPSFNVGTGQSNTVLLTIPHGQKTTPLVNIYVAGSMISFSTGSLIASTYTPLPILSTGNVDSSYFFVATDNNTYIPLSILYAVDNTNIYIEANHKSTGDVYTIKPIPVTYFILQETAS